LIEGQMAEGPEENATGEDVPATESPPPETEPESAPPPPARLAIPSGPDKTRKFRLLPLKIGLWYLGATFLLFLFGPIDYPLKNPIPVVACMALVMVFLTVGFRAGVHRAARPSKLNITRIVFILGAILAVLILIPSAYYYTGKLPWEFLTAIRDQRSAYSSLASQLAATEGQRGPIILIRSLAMPLVWAVIPIGVIYWSRLGLVYRALLASTVLCSLIFSALRGTDREIGDLLIVSGSAYAVAAARRAFDNVRTPRRALVNMSSLAARRLRAGLIAALALTVSGSVFVERKEDRMNTVNAFCFLNSGACANYAHPLVVGMNDSGRFATSMSVAYITNGYYGLSLALGKPFIPSWGLGHSPAISRIYDILAGGEEAGTRTYNYRNIDEGWPQEYYWSTMLTSLANDVSFPGAIALMGVFAWAWGRSWMDAVVARNDSAAIVFCLATFSILYFPANLQILQTLEGYSTVLFWMVAWLCFRQRGMIRS
jgi:hypothetical protein